MSTTLISRRKKQEPKEWPHNRLPVVPAYRSGSRWFNVSQEEIKKRWVPKPPVNMKAKIHNLIMKKPEIMDPDYAMMVRNRRKSKFTSLDKQTASIIA